MRPRTRPGFDCSSLKEKVDVFRNKKFFVGQLLFMYQEQVDLSRPVFREEDDTEQSGVVGEVHILLLVIEKKNILFYRILKLPSQAWTGSDYPSFEGGESYVDVDESLETYIIT